MSIVSEKFKGLTPDELLELVIMAKEELAARRGEVIDSIRAEVLAKLDASGIMLEEFLEGWPVRGLRKRIAAEKPFVDPESGVKWSGRGKSPKWVLDECHKMGVSISEYKKMIKEASQASTVARTMRDT